MSRILVVDDEPGVLRLVTEVLTRAGHEATGVVHSAESLPLMGSQSFDVALVDYDMPAPDGVEVLSRLSNIQPRCLRILMSGKLDLPVVIDAVNRGEIARLLPKPFRPAQLLEVVEATIASRQRMIEQMIGDSEQDLGAQRQQLEECLGGDACRLALQPIVRSADSQVMAFEALIRSRHPVLDNPAKLLMAAEAHDMLHELADVVTDRLLLWYERVPAEVKLFMNVHPRELCDPERLRRRLARLEPFASRLVLEITERSYLLELDTWSESVNELIQRGYGLAVDDLGSGYNSLAVLAALRPHYIKVDMSIVRGVDANDRKRGLIELLVRFADSSAAKLIAEGVETEAEAATLRACGAHLLQGYFFGRPSVDPEQVAAWT